MFNPMAAISWTVYIADERKKKTMENRQWTLINILYKNLIKNDGIQSIQMFS